MTSSASAAIFPLLATLLFNSFVGQIFLLEFSVGSTVRVKFSHRNFSGKFLPNSVNVTVTSQTNTTTVLQLSRRDDVNVPIVTVTADDNGTIFTTQEHVPHRKNTGIYRDFKNQAVILLTRHNDPSEVNAILTLKGKFQLGSLDYFISPRERVKRDDTSGYSSDEIIYTIKPIEIPPTNAQFDYVKSAHKEGFQDSNPPQTAGQQRKRRAASQDYYIDIVAGVDSVAWGRFVVEENNKTTAQQSMLEYYAIVFTGIDLMYQNIDTAIMKDRLNIRLIKIVVFETINSLPIHYFYVGDEHEKIDGGKALYDLAEHFNTTLANGNSSGRPYDHFMMFVGLDLYLDDTTGNYSDLLGIALLACTCQLYGVSVIEDIKDYVAIYTGAHELGHSLSANHDGQNNKCPNEDRYIMATSDSPETPETRLHPWLFSNCSIEAFKSFIEEQLQTEQGADCLMKELPIVDEHPNVTDILIGQNYSLDEQCKLSYGDTSYNCRVGNRSSVCSEMYCSDMNDECLKFKAALPGTSCGSRKICKQGDCVFDQAAPSIQESICPFEDVAKEQFDCINSIISSNHMCYNSNMYRYCCNMCQSLRREVKGCEFGDRVSNCSVEQCSNATDVQLTNCCETCSNETTSNNTCRDVPTSLPKGFNCVNYVTSLPNACYNDDVRTGCCQSCGKVRTNTVGCEYGDRQPRLCPLIKSCQNVTDLCCATCARLNINGAAVLHPARGHLVATITIALLCFTIMISVFTPVNM